ncbi:WG repeat-containing protein [Campylobacter lari]|uniref:WG repeat-containing protein n=3 Tax=Campylobacter lari TaxID=201 RepID=A0A6N6BCY8_CAMLA|nr:WG repeat-containing protein [Campylobacter lari]EAJ0338064.1 WG repeat-containing protein [Campylobacter lari]EAK1230574.1 WG repeat-containing protein [Campylobacter lari]EDP6814313.1 hypothetical protein [Campylobacter lari]EHL5011117.1 WG repeat-containing protein [Campylobacter lari]
MAAVKLYNTWGFINTNGDFVIKPKFDDVWYFSGGKARVKLNEKWVYIDKKGNIVPKD